MARSPRIPTANAQRTMLTLASRLSALTPRLGSARFDPNLSMVAGLLLAQMDALLTELDPKLVDEGRRLAPEIWHTLRPRFAGEPMVNAQKHAIALANRLRRMQRSGVDPSLSFPLGQLQAQLIKVIRTEKLDETEFEAGVAFAAAGGIKRPTVDLSETLPKPEGVRYLTDEEKKRRRSRPGKSRKWSGSKGKPDAFGGSLRARQWSEGR